MYDPTVQRGLHPIQWTARHTLGAFSCLSNCGASAGDLRYGGQCFDCVNFPMAVSQGGRDFPISLDLSEVQTTPHSRLFLTAQRRRLVLTGAGLRYTPASLDDRGPAHAG